MRKHLIKVGNEYQEKLELVKDIYEMLGEGVVSYQALTRDMKEAVNLYIENQADFRDVGNVELKPWQNELMKYIEPHDREIIWVVGKSGAEGKTWLQNYIKYKYGNKRVVSGVSLLTKSGNHALPVLATGDICFFNIPKSVNTLTEINYEMLESIKDGELTDSQRIKVDTPNIFMVFSNDVPNTSRLVKDRWKLFFIENDQIKECNI